MTVQSPPTQRGVALIIVLWITVLLTVIVGGYVLVNRTEMMQARYLYDGTRARYAAEAGVHRAAYELRNPDLETRWHADGRGYEFDYSGAAVTVSITDETGKIDINAANEPLLDGLFSASGVDEQTRLELIDAVLDWRDSDDLVRLHGAEDDDYEGAGYPYGAKDAPFDTVEELQQVMGVSYALYRLLEPAITVYSGRATANAAYAPLEVLQAMPMMNRELALTFIAARELEQGFNAPLPLLPDGTQPVAQGSGLTYSIRSRATMGNGSWTELQVTIRQGGSFLGRPFRILRLKQGFVESGHYSREVEET